LTISRLTRVVSRDRVPIGVAPFCRAAPARAPLAAGAAGPCSRYGSTVYRIPAETKLPENWQ
jgi:hypothetical protein